MFESQVRDHEKGRHCCELRFHTGNVTSKGKVKGVLFYTSRKEN